jgi:hypothetical protein
MCLLEFNGICFEIFLIFFFKRESMGILKILIEFNEKS